MLGDLDAKSWHSGGFTELLSSSESEMLHATVAPSGKEISQRRETKQKNTKIDNKKHGYVEINRNIYRI